MKSHRKEEVGKKRYQKQRDKTKQKHNRMGPDQQKMVRE